MIKSLLIANRGEIACRIIRTARRMGIRSIAVYSDADADALHVSMADEAHRVGPAAASESYLRAGRILSIAKEAGADALHPGYGFLSENDSFAELCADAGIIFVGPPPSAIREMGLKDRAKELMKEADVPVVPGYHGDKQQPDFLKRKAYEIGYPALIKAVAGGGGKGMRLVEKALEFDDALEAAKREAQNAFGNERVLIERFIANPRHVEVQVFADSHGNVVHLFERDCSLQRRHQKVIEEAPAPGMTDEVRAAMGKAACDAARAVGYQGAGTVEFIADGSDGLKEDGFFFMEMNTRLQVEHPVTEAITGLDLVEWQIKVAQGDKLPLAQDDLKINGHAVEARLYAEDPQAGFLPSTGKLIACDLPAENDNIRVDSGVETGKEISPHYDPMIAKIIAHAETRTEALDALNGALRKTAIIGPKSNVSFLTALTGDKDFRKGNFDTGLIDRKIDKLVEGEKLGMAVVTAGVGELYRFAKKNAADRALAIDANASKSPWSASDGFNLGPARNIPFDFQIDDEKHRAHLLFEDDGLTISTEWGDGSGETGLRTARDGSTVYMASGGAQWRFEPFDPATERDEDAAHSGNHRIAAPMSGRVVTVTVADGDQVEQGDILFSVEAMKMEHAVIAPADGVVSGLTIAAGDQVAEGAIALELEALEDVEAA